MMRSVGVIMTVKPSVKIGVEKIRWVEELYRMHYTDLSRCLNA